jgi:hypothetical protein
MIALRRAVEDHARRATVTGPSQLLVMLLPGMNPDFLERVSVHVGRGCTQFRVVLLGLRECVRAFTCVDD